MNVFLRLSRRGIRKIVVEGLHHILSGNNSKLKNRGICGLPASLSPGRFPKVLRPDRLTRAAGGSNQPRLNGNFGSDLFL